jgi:SRSO17 transposase
MAARVDPGRVGAAHQSLHHFVAKAAWDDAAVLAAVRDLVLPALLERGPIRAWIIDDTGMPKKGRHSVGVARQYCGQIGKQDNCQVAVSLSVATDQASLPVAFQLYLPETWAADAERRAGIPDDVAFQTKPAIALDQIRAAMTAGLPPGVVLMDTGYGKRHRSARGRERAGADLPRRGSVLADGLAARRGTLAAQAVEWQGTAAEAPAPRSWT